MKLYWNKQLRWMAGSLLLGTAALGMTACTDEEKADFTVALTGGAEVPPVTTTASGTATVDVDSATGLVTVNVKTSGLVTPTAAHVHDNFAGGNGPVLFGLTQDAANPGNFSGEATFTPEQLLKLEDGGLYINVHTSEVASGELRGQILGADVSVISFPLEGSQEVPPVTTEHSGAVSITLIGDSGFALRGTHDVGDDATAAHIHEAEAGSNGGVLVGLTLDASTISIDISGEDFTTALRDGLGNGGLYVNLHSNTVASGELRGQIIDGGLPAE